jgi:hypothetical protein
MRAHSTKSFRLSRATTLLGVAVAISLASVAIPHRSSAQAPGNPIPVLVQTANVMCVIGNAAGCVTCTPVFGLPPATGCTSPPPGAWSPGACGGVGLGCTDWTNYNCGSEVFCVSGFPTGINCNGVFNICS